MLSGISATARRASVVTIHAAQSASRAASPSQGARFFRTARLNDLGVLKHTPEFNALMQSQNKSISQVEAHLKCQLKEFPNAKAWLRVVRQINTELQTGESSLNKLNGEASLALMLTLLEEGYVCNADLLCEDFAALAFNLHGLGDITIAESEKRKIAQLARCAVDAFCELMPPTGRAFFQLPAQARQTSLNGFVAQLARDAHRLGLGIREEDVLALIAQPIMFLEQMAFGGGGFDLLQDGTPVVVLSHLLLGESDELVRLIAESGRTRDVRYLELIEILVHELIHACQRSSFSAVPPDMEHFKRRLALMLSAGASSALKNSFRAQDLPTLPAHERPAWYGSTSVWSAFYQSRRVEASMREAASTLLTHPKLVRVTDQLTGDEPLDFVNVQELQRPAQETTPPPPDHFAIPVHLLTDW